jgi:ParB family chromosome partitioning protein
MAEAPTVPVRIVNLSDAEALEAQLIENLQRRDVHARRLHLQGAGSR